MNKHHGALYTIKYMKASHVALQRFISGSPVQSLSEIEPNYRFPTMIDGLPSIMSPFDRDSITRRINNSPDIVRY
jgi:hypothetical protein